MEGCAKLENLLEEQEIINIPQSAKVKIIAQFLSYYNLINKLREENAESIAILEREQFRFEKEVSVSKEQLHESIESGIKLKLQIAELEEGLSSVQKQWRDLQKIHDSSLLDFQSTKRENELLLQEKRILSEQLDKRRVEIEKFNDDLKNLLEQVTSANEAKFESIALAEEAKLKESNLQHQVNRLEQEKDLLNRQIVDLHAELTQKNSEIHTLKREKSSNVFEMKNLLEERADQLHLAQKKVDSYKELLEEKDARIEALAEKIRQLNMSHCKSEEQYNLELSAQTKLIDIHKKASEDNQKRVQELMRAFEEARKLLNDSNEACTEMEKHCHELEKKCKLQLEEKQVDISKLKEELRRSKDAAQGINQDKIEQLFPVAAATSKVLHSGMTLTDLYVQYTSLQEELQQEKNENANRTRELNNIIAEIEEKTPIIQQKMMEFDKLNETISYLKSQQSVALLNNEKLLQERNDAKRLYNLANRENMRLKSQVVDLNRQVQMLLKEVEEARGGFVKDCRDSVYEEQVSSTDDITAAKVISRHLVTFRDIEELQMKNQQLLTAIRDLSQQHEEMEKKVSTELTSKFEKEIANLSTELEDLQKKRVKQSEMLETIIRQRDMYRVLLTSQGFSESLLGKSEGSLLQHSASPFLPADPKETKSAMAQLQVEFDIYKKEKAKSERMLNDQMDKMRSESSDLRIQNAKLASQCEYSEERVKILQSNMETYKKEYTSSKDKNKQHSTLIVQHQQTINSLRQDLMLAQEKIAKYEVAIENLKAERDLLKSIETRLLQEKDSVVREQQHQSRMMANLQAVQNNLERIESETKRNLQHQVEKFEKEVIILKSKVENANEEYRSAVNVWEKQKKELQSKIDAEIVRNRKMHKELVDSYSQMHALKQELSMAKNQSSVVPEKSANSDLQTKSPLKSASPAPSLAEVKLLKEQLSEAQAKLKALQDKLSITTKSSEQYLNMCKDLELRVKEQDEINKQLKDSMDNALNSGNETRTSLEKKLESMEKNNRELIEENMKLTQDSNSQISDLQKKMNNSSKIIENFKNEAESAKKTAEQARVDCQNQLKLMQEVQEKYERELMLHAEDVQTLTEIKEEHQTCSLKFEKLTETTKSAEHALSENKESWSRQEEMLRGEIRALKSKISDLDSCNNNLHNQLEMIGTQMAALQSKNWEDTPYASIQSDLKDTQHLLQVIQFIKKEKEIAVTQFDVTQSENIRLNIKVEQLTNELNSIKSELKEVINNAQAKAASEAQHAELLKKIEMMNLLSESNNLLRMEKESLTETKTKLENELHDLQERFQPLCEKEKELSQNIDMLTAENSALRVEVKNWQSRTNQLLEQSHRIGPQEYKNVMREMEELKCQKIRLAEELQRKQAEVSQVTANNGLEINSLRKELDSLRKEKKDKDVETQKMVDENAEHQKTVLQLKKIARKYKQQFDELKSSYDVLEEKSKVFEASTQEQATAQEMQKKITDSEKELVELKEDLQKQKQIVEQVNKEAALVQSTAREKEEKAKKLLAQFRQKYAQINREKEALSDEKKKLAKEVEEHKNQISHLMMSQEENAQMKTHSSAKILRLEKELKTANDLRMSERKQYDELLQKVAQQKQGIKSPIGSLDRTSSGTEPLTANIKPIPSPSTSGASSGLRHSPHPVSSTNRPTPTASIRPMAIGSSASATPTQTRMAAVLPTTATPPHSTEEVGAPSPSVAVPQATVQPTPATATVAPHTMAVTASPVISEVVPAIEETEVTSLPSVHPANIPVSAPATALVPPRIDISESTPESVLVDSPAPTTSVIVSPPATQTQVVTPTVKRPRDESPGEADVQEASLKRIRMVSEGSQTNQQHPTSVVTPTNVAVVPAAHVIRSQSPAIDEPQPSTSTQLDDKDETTQDAGSPQNISSVTEEELLASESIIGEILEDDKEEQIIEWETQEEQETKIDDEFEAEVMEEETISGEVDEDIEQMQGIDVRSPDDEDMTEEQPDDADDMTEQPTPPDIDILDSVSNMQMDADSSSLQSAPTEQVMAPPAFPPTLEPPSSSTPSAESVVIPVSAPMQRTPVTLVPPRIERQAPVSRQHLTPFTIPGQGSNFEEGDDSIVPSTPTLYVPRRADGFAEAVSSPHVPQVRFLFSSSESSPTQQGLSQLASEEGLGFDDTRMDLSQFDEGSRTVPSTPLQVSPPATAEANVPDINPNLEADSTVLSNEIIVPTIKVDLVEEPLQSTSSAHNSQNFEVFDPVFSDSPLNKKEQELKDVSKHLTVPTPDQPGPSEAQEETPAAESSLKVEEGTVVESEQSSKDIAASPCSQRKPIVWSKKTGESTLTSPETSASAEAILSPTSPSQALLPTPGRGRVRTRRPRFTGGTATRYSRGRGADRAWSGSGIMSSAATRRGRSPRRRPMY